jgi:hypothetical protein
VQMQKLERMMQGFRSPGGLRASSLSSPLSVASSSHPAHNAPHSKTAFTASRRSQSGKLRPEPWPESNPQGRTSPVHPNSS